MVTIVDGADNLFIDTVTNSTRIAVDSSSQLSWIFQQLFHAVIENKLTDVSQARNFLSSTAKTQSEKDSLIEVSDHQIQRWIENAIHAKFKLKKKKISIMLLVSIITHNNMKFKLLIKKTQEESTLEFVGGESLHEFVEVKENL